MQILRKLLVKNPVSVSSQIKSIFRYSECFSGFIRVSGLCTMPGGTDQLFANADKHIQQLEQKIKDLEEKLSSIDIKSNSIHHENKTEEAVVAGREKTRLTKSSGKDISSDEGRIGGAFVMKENPEFLQQRLQIFERLYEQQQKRIGDKPKVPIKISLPDGSVKEGLAWETSPLHIAKDISEGLAKASIIAKVKYIKRISEEVKVTVGMEEFEEAGNSSAVGELWDMARPLEGDCQLQLLKFDDPEAKMVFWHSAAHVLGECLECKFGSYLTVGPPVNPGFYYDSYVGENGITDSMLKDLNNMHLKLSKEKQEFQRLVLTKNEALEMFAYNPYKVSIIKNKVAEGGMTSVYRNGPFVDLCMGPHIVDTGAIKAVELKQATTAFWLGSDQNDKLQRVHGVAFPDKKLLKEHKEMIKKAEENDHRKRGLEQDLFFFHQLSPGCAFWAPHGAHIFNKLVNLMQTENRIHGFTEVVTPNVFSIDLWKISGHWEHYQKNMFTFSDGEHENSIFGLKPMNCPGHCLIFDSKARSYRELPLRLSDFGVLHRNEASGALSGLTRVRRFQQDDAHIYCRRDQVKEEVLMCLKLVKKIYDMFGLTMKVARSTRPKKASGLLNEDGSANEEGVRLWDEAEAQLAEALDEFVGKGNWKDNPGDGAFYGPKIDVQVFDSMKRQHQCATVQLDFQMPIRFKLKYVGDGHDTEEGQSKRERPVMIHRAVLGSIERMTAILTEHFGGKWPFWLSPRQVMIIPVANALNDYAQELQKKLYSEGFAVEVDLSTKTLNKKILLAQKEQFNFMFIVGAQEKENGSVNVRSRKNNQLGEMKYMDVLAMMKKYVNDKSLDTIVDPEKDIPIAPKDSKAGEENEDDN